MSEAGSGKRRKQSARERIAAQQAAARRAEARRRMLLTGGAVVVVLAVVVAFFIIKSFGNSSSGATETVTGSALPASVDAQIVGVPVGTLAKVGTGSALSYNPRPINSINGTALTQSGKPELLYIGAEFCPLCAAERWAMAVALSRFGTFSPLHGIHSSSSDSFPNTATLTFYKSSYSSKYLVFTPVENENVDHGPLQDTTRAQQAIWDKYNPNSYPFIDFGNKFMINTLTYDPQVLQGRTWSQIAAALQVPSSAIAQGADGSANLMTAAICKITNNQPGSVCGAAPITSLEGRL
jgi:Domain of unknown function (DUF929)